MDGTISWKEAVAAMACRKRGRPEYPVPRAQIQSGSRTIFMCTALQLDQHDVIKDFTDFIKDDFVTYAKKMSLKI
jgi:hypothetical protein